MNSIKYKLYKDAVTSFISDILAFTLAISAILSFITMFSAKETCKTYAYYLPATYIVCNINKYRDGSTHAGTR